MRKKSAHSRQYKARVLKGLFLHQRPGISTLLDMQILDPTPAPPGQKLSLGPAIYAFTNLQGDFDARSSLRITSTRKSSDRRGMKRLTAVDSSKDSEAL